MATQLFTGTRAADTAGAAALLEGKNAIIYGAGGAVGGAVARAYARAGATVFLAGRTRDTLEAVADDIAAGGGRAEVTVLDALDERAVEEHVEAVIARAGRIDISLNLIWRGDVQGTPLVEMAAADFMGPITVGLTSAFVTAGAAARRMVGQGSGVILALNSGSAHGSPMMGGTGPADAALDTFIRNLAAEIGPRGVRAAGIWACAIPETMSAAQIGAVVNGGEPLDDAAFGAILAGIDAMRMLPRSPRIDQVAAVATFLASDAAAAITGAFVNATGGVFPS